MSHRFLLVLLTCFTLIACGDGPDKDAGGDSNSAANNDNGANNSSSQNNASQPDIDCATACPEKETECGAPEGTFDCATLCAQLTPAQVACVDGASCEALFTADSFEELCAGGSNNSNNDNNTSNGCDEPARCDGDELVTCEVNDSGVPVTTRSFCSAGCSDGECQGPPQEVTVSGTYPSQDPITVLDEEDGILVSSATARAEDPTYSVELPDSININADGVTYTIQSPDEGDCATSLTVVLNNSAVSVGVLGQDELPASDCSNFVDDVASDNITLIARNVPYLNIGGTVDITLELQAQ